MIPKIDEKKESVMKNTNKKGKVGMQKIEAEKNEEEEKQLEQQFGTKENIDGLPDEHYSKEKEEGPNSTEILLASADEWAMKEHQKLEPIES